MAVSKNLVCETWPASGDLSSKQYYLMKLNTSGQAATAGAAAIITGVLQNDPAASGRGAEVAVGGVTKVHASTTATGAISVESALISSSVGVAVVESTGGTGFVFGRAMEALSTGSTGLISVRITREGPQSTA